MTTYRQRIGKSGEKLAEDYLTARGLILVDKNFRTSYGEIDLVMKDGNCLVFIEVKSRKSLAFGMPEESITKKKLERMTRSAMAYVQQLEEPIETWRIDVVSLILDANFSNPQIAWFENVLA